MLAPLAGKTIVLLRAKGQGGALAPGFLALGARVVNVPLIAIAPPEDPAPLAAAIAAIASYDWVALTSPNAASAFLQGLEATGVPPGEALTRTKVASVGPGTSARLRESGLEPALEARESLQEGLARALAALGVEGKRVLIPRSDLAREALARELEAAGALVAEVTAYRNVEGEGSADDVRRVLDAGCDVVCFTSASTVRSLARRIGGREMKHRFDPGRPLAASMGPVASSALREVGVEPGIEATAHTAEGLVAAVLAALEKSAG
jgi:uroporphyrinogen III methyltransferase/synthase